MTPTGKAKIAGTRRLSEMVSFVAATRLRTGQSFDALVAEATSLTTTKPHECAYLAGPADPILITIRRDFDRIAEL